MKTPPLRRWFRISLRTLFVVVGVLCLGLGWLSWQVRIASARRTMLLELPGLSGADVMYNRYVGPPPAQWSKRPGGLRLWLGDEPQLVLRLPWAEGDARTLPVERLFPESYLVYAPPATHVDQPE